MPILLVNVSAYVSDNYFYGHHPTISKLTKRFNALEPILFIITFNCIGSLSFRSLDALQEWNCALQARKGSDKSIDRKVCVKTGMFMNLL